MLDAIVRAGADITGHKPGDLVMNVVLYHYTLSFLSARPAVTCPASQHHRLWSAATYIILGNRGTRVWECEQLAQSQTHEL